MDQGFGTNDGAAAARVPWGPAPWGLARSRQSGAPSAPATDDVRALAPTLRATHHDVGPLLWVLELSGEADLSTWELLRAELDRVATNRTKLVLDVSGLRFCDVHCAQMILTGAADKQRALVGARGPVERVFEILDPHQVVPRYGDLSAATGTR